MNVALVVADRQQRRTVRPALEQSAPVVDVVSRATSGQSALRGAIELEPDVGTQTKDES